MSKPTSSERVETTHLDGGKPKRPRESFTNGYTSRGSGKVHVSWHSGGGERFLHIELQTWLGNSMKFLNVLNIPGNLWMLEVTVVFLENLFITWIFVSKISCSTWGQNPSPANQAADSALISTRSWG